MDDLYVKLLGRATDAAGHDYWTSQAHASTGIVALRFYQSEEARRARVQRLYQEFLGRSADPAGLAFWADRLTTVDDLALTDQLLATPEYATRTSRQ